MCYCVFVFALLMKALQYTSLTLLCVLYVWLPHILQDSLSSLKHLVSLDLSKNQLTELPHGIGHLSNLKRLSLYGNQLKTLPLDFSLLKQLVFLDLKNNPLEEELAAVAGTCTDEQECTECARKVRAGKGREEEGMGREGERRVGAG